MNGFWKRFIKEPQFGMRLEDYVNGSNRRTEENHSDSEANGGTSDMARTEYSTTGAGGNTPAIASTSLEKVEQLEPIRAWRGLNISAEGNNVALAAINAHFGKFLAVEHKAECHAHSNDPYGFYSMAQLVSAYTLTYPNAGISQTVTKPVHAAPHETCTCGFYGVKEKKDAIGIFVAEADFYGKVIEHEIGYRAEYQRILSVRVQRPDVCLGSFLCDGTPELLIFPEGGTPAVICKDCAVGQPRIASLAKLAARLGVEVRWND